MGHKDGSLLPEGWKFIWGKLPFKKTAILKKKITRQELPNLNVW